MPARLQAALGLWRMRSVIASEPIAALGCVAPAGGLPAVSITGVSPVVFENFKILGSAATTQGAPSVAFQVTQNSQVTLTNSLVVGGKGGGGAPGVSQPAGLRAEARTSRRPAQTRVVRTAMAGLGPAT